MSHSVEEMTALYDEYDKNGDGKVSVHELKAGIKAKFCADVDDKKVVAIFQGLDMDGDNCITKNEFLDQMCSKISRRVGFSKQFQQLDTDNSGYLTVQEVKPLLQNDYDDGQIEQMFKDVDADSNGKVSCEEFLKLM
ncbi:uncharacterized protein LOC143067331 [Mytilus galloprovincialis]|uniref:Sulfhydryl light chain n=1 Tax=Mytilus galloprovincialis TaxID=29158 RepID=A0A8B6CHC6_MYTGA|nr:Hypothetical predicted protein [Mytilus galloprovincialis]